MVTIEEASTRTKEDTLSEMRYATIYTTEQEYSHFIELAKNLCYVKKIETDKETRDSALHNIRAGLEEVRLFQKGILKTTSAKDFLNEL
jgi:hypothetical protein